MLYGSLPLFVPLDEGDFRNPVNEAEGGCSESREGGCSEDSSVHRVGPKGVGGDTMDASSMMVHESEEAALRREYERLRSEVEAQQKAEEMLLTTLQLRIDSVIKLEMELDEQRSMVLWWGTPTPAAELPFVHEPWPPWPS